MEYCQSQTTFKILISVLFNFQNENVLEFLSYTHDVTQALTFEFHTTGTEDLAILLKHTHFWITDLKGKITGPSNHVCSCF